MIGFPIIPPAKNAARQTSTVQIAIYDNLLLKFARTADTRRLFKKNCSDLYDNFICGGSPDITFGLVFNKPDMNIGFSYRTLGSKMQGFDDKVSIRRHSIMLESYKNLFNWLGFVPFAGLTASIENLNVNVNGQKYSETKPAIGFIFGWDIRVTKTGTSLLRTNLRWTPNLHIAIDNKKMMFDNLEFNFIQWVQFIGRKRIYKKYQ